MVFVVDHDDDMRGALARPLRSAGYRVEAYDCADTFLGYADLAHCPACALLDLQLPERSGLTVQRKLHATLPIIFISGHRDVSAVVEAMKDGATDFLLKPVRDSLLLDATGRALERSRRMLESRRELADIQHRASRLTPREREVMTLVVAGCLNKQVASELGTAEKTIKIHRARVMEKMKAKSLPELVRLADKVFADTDRVS
ncbi:Response regulator protein TmoT [Pararobbsia alpina]|uniref:Response regulator protein TmoT n=2 Tax=Pararobbsia alpina TaxID=621374 RepID=A0A6S7B8K3_9BURK|nr:Response regulator protein TmoT [Pararobbsia alpina]